MSRLRFTSAVYHGDACLGELDVVPGTDQSFQFPNNEIRIHHISPLSKRFPPLSILQTISLFSVRCKLESSSTVVQPYLMNLHASCLDEQKTVVVLLGDEEIHMVAMPTKQKKIPCFWCYSVPTGIYDSCLRILNLRCLAIVFDIDETLVVANTMKSFEDQIKVLRERIARKALFADPMLIIGMATQLKRYVDDCMLLKQYMESDCVVDNGKMFKVQPEEVPPLTKGQEKVLRPVIRLQERNIVLTRINPLIRDTSVLVRLRPAWEDLRSYLTAKGRRRFEVYVCTMAERDYALEMWRLLDPEMNLIDSKQLLDRVVCVKSGLRKSLRNVFQDGMCRPNMAMVIDDNLKVWEDKDQARVHIVPAFTPYYSPQAETENTVPVLCVTRNVACYVRGCFFKEFDENLVRRISKAFYEDDVVNLPPAPDVSNYLMSKDSGFVSNGNLNGPISEGMNEVEVERRLNQRDEKSIAESSIHSTTNISELRCETSHFAMTRNVVGTASAATLSRTKKRSYSQVQIEQSPLKIDLQLDDQLPSQVKLERHMASSLSNWPELKSFCINMDGRGLLSFLCQHLKGHDSMRSAISDSLELASDPAKLVLGVLPGFLHPNEYFRGLRLYNARSSCVLLLEQLMKVALRIEPSVNEEALKLAVDWKKKVVNNYAPEIVYGLLQFIVTYRLVSTFDADELLGLLVRASDHKQSPELCLALGLSDKIPILVENLLKKPRMLEAMEYVCAFELFHEFPPGRLLRGHWRYHKRKIYKGKNLHLSQNQMIDREIEIVRDIIKCIADHKLESHCPPEELENYIVELEKQKACGNDSTEKLPAPSFKAQLPVEGGNKNPRRLV